jgi:predicted DNA-binding ribbon-helix-helix protein
MPRFCPLHHGGVKWCIEERATNMATQDRDMVTKVTGEPKMPRASISFPPELYATLEQIAKEKKVSVAWVVREAAEMYVSGQWPLFARTGQ